MPKVYRCPICRTEKYFELTEKVWLQPACSKAGCSGRLEFIESTPGPVPPPVPAAMTASDIDALTEPIIVDRAGTFCTYRLEEDRRAWKIKFRGWRTAEPATVYEFELTAGEQQAYEVPAWSDRDDSTSQRFVLNSAGSIDFAKPPAMLPENKIQSPQGRGAPAFRSIGHGAGLRTPIRIQLGAQDANNEHSGSGLIHIMFAHGKTNIAGVEQLLNSILSSNQIGAIYKSVAPEFGFYRYFFLNRAAAPYRLVTEQRPEFFRLITVFKPDTINEYSQFRTRTDRYARVYSWDKDRY